MDDEARVEERREPSTTCALLRSRASLVARAAWVPAAALAAVVAGGVAVAPAIFAATPLVALFATFFLLARGGARRPAVIEGPLAVREGEVWVGPRRLAPLAALRHGVVLPESEGTVLRLEASGQTFDLAFADAAAAEHALAELGLDATHAVARFPVLARDVAVFRRRLTRVIGGLVLGILLALGGAALHSVALFLGCLLPAIALSLSLLVPTTVVVGTDGLTLRRLGRAEFIGFDGLSHAEVAEGPWTMGSETVVVRLVGKDGAPRHEILVDQRKEGPYTEALRQEIVARAQGLASRIDAAIAARGVGATALDRGLLARGTEAPRAWVRSLAALRGRLPTFRAATPPDDEGLLTLLEDPSAAAHARLGAAIALAPRDGSARARVRVAAQATAAPALRVALESTLEEDEDALVAAVEAVDREASAASDDTHDR